MLGEPGKARFRLPSSIGETRAPAIAAGMFAAGMMMRRPLMSLGSISRISLQSVTWPSYSSPWLPPRQRTVGPVPRATTVIGTMTLTGVTYTITSYIYGTYSLTNQSGQDAEFDVTASASSASVKGPAATSPLATVKSMVESGQAT